MLIMRKTFHKIYNKLKILFIKKVINIQSDKNISLNETIIAEYIYLNEGISIKTLAEVFKLSPSNINYKLENLINKKIIKKEQSKIDKREFILFICDEYKNYNLREDRYMSSLKTRLQIKLGSERYKDLEEIIIEVDDEIV